jgi:DNA repair protein RecO (recombination protein O)
MADGRQIQHCGEAIVLRTWPFHEADLLVSLFTREQGKVRGVARHAMKSRRRFGGALEPGTIVRANYTERPKQELVRLDSFEIVWSPLTSPIDTLRLAGLQLVVEVLEEAMPELAVDDNIFRLAATVLRAMEGTAAPPKTRDVLHSEVWLPVTYFCLWMNRLMGWWPELGHCAACGLDLRDPALRDQALRDPARRAGDVWWSPNADGVTCADDRRPGSKRLSADSVRESMRMGRVGLAELLAEEWTKGRAADLRAFVVGLLERHLDRRLRCGAALL